MKSATYAWNEVAPMLVGHSTLVYGSNQISIGLNWRD